MEFLFVLGKNPELSLAELISYFKTREIKFEILDFKNNFALVDTKKVPEIKELGGTIKIAKLIQTLNKIEDIKEIEISKIFNLEKKKIIFGVSFYNSKNPKIRKNVSKILKEKLSKKGIKSRFIPKEVSHTEIVLRGFEDVVLFFGKKIYLGKTFAVHNPFEFQRRDIKRPVQNPEISLPIRLARIMLNLAGCKPGFVVLDPFCGLGTILQEAALSGLEIRGLDSNKEMVEATKSNLKWLEKEYGIKINNLNEKIIQGDSRRISSYFKNIDAIVTEPYFGPTLKGLTSEKRAIKIIKELETLYNSCFSEFKKVLKSEGRICISIPAIKTKKGYLGLKFKRIYSSHGFEKIKINKINFPIKEGKKTLIREIYLLKKRI